MTEYFIRADGTETTFTAATGPASSASACMTPATFNAGKAALVAGDIVTVSGRGGTITDQLEFNISGSAGSPIRYRGEVGNEPVLDVSGDLVTEMGCIYVAGSNLQYIEIDGFPDCTGNGSRGVFRMEENGTGSATVLIAKTAPIVVTANDADFTGTEVHDGFSFAGDCKAACGTLEAHNCHETTPAGGPHQALTTHNTCAVTVDSLTASDCNVHVVPANGSSVTIETADLGDWLVYALQVDSDGGDIVVNGGSITQSSSASTARLWEITTGDSTGTITLNDVDVTVEVPDGAGDETQWNGVITVTGGTWTINSDRFRMQPDNAGSIIFEDVVLDLIKWDQSIEFIANAPQGGGAATNVTFRRCTMTNTGGGIGGGRLIDQEANSSNDAVVESCLFVDFVVGVDVFRVQDAATAGVDVKHCTFVNVTGGPVFNLDEVGAVAVSTVHSNIFHDCQDVFDVFDALALDSAGNRYSGTTPDEGDGDTEDPLFVSEGAGNYRLQQSSPAAAAGEPLGASLDDRDGNAFDEAAPSQGAYQVQAGGPTVVSVSTDDASGGYLIPPDYRYSRRRKL